MHPPCWHIDRACKKTIRNCFIQKLCIWPATTSVMQLHKLHMLHQNRMYCDLRAIFTAVLLLWKYGLFVKIFHIHVLLKPVLKYKVLLYSGKSVLVREPFNKNVKRKHLEASVQHISKQEIPVALPILPNWQYFIASLVKTLDFSSFNSLVFICLMTKRYSKICSTN